MPLNAEIKVGMDMPCSVVYPRTGRPSPIEYGSDPYDMAELFSRCTSHDASDLHLAVGRPPVIRSNSGFGPGWGI